MPTTARHLTPVRFALLWATIGTCLATLLVSPAWAEERAGNYDKGPFAYLGVGRTEYDNLYSSDARFNPTIAVGYSFASRFILDAELEVAVGRDKVTLGGGWTDESTLSRLYSTQMLSLNVGGMGRVVGGFGMVGVARLGLGEETETWRGQEETRPGGSNWGYMVGAGLKVAIRRPLLLRVDVRWSGVLDEPERAGDDLDGSTLALRAVTLALEYHF